MVTFSPWKNDSIVNCIIQQKNTRTGFVNMSGNINSVMKQLKTIYRDHANILGSRLKMQIYFFYIPLLITFLMMKMQIWLLSKVLQSIKYFAWLV